MTLPWPYADVLQEPPSASLEAFSEGIGEVVRSVRLRDGTVAKTSEADLTTSHSSSTLRQRFEDSWLRRQYSLGVTAPAVTVADLFCGCGGLTVGAHEAARAVGLHAVPVLAVDNNEAALTIYRANFPEAESYLGDIEDLVDGELGDRLSSQERKLMRKYQGLDLAIGGPPCQGHSDLNNHTRRKDPKNMLYLSMARFVEVVRPRFAVIENVPGVAHDRNSVLEVTAHALRLKGYTISTGVIRASDVGGAQIRRRHFLLASLDPEVIPDVSRIPVEFAAPSRPVLDVIADLDIESGLGTFGTSAKHSALNQARIDFLFARNLYDLPDALRPDCHRLKRHSYRAVYGRMHPDRPAPTITAGFGSTGQGRFVHPLHPRTLTPHEAARVQGFPDWFRFSAETKRVALQEMIGNAVPPRLAYAAVASLLR